MFLGNDMKLLALIIEYVSKGYEIRLGKHINLDGYFAQIIPNCEQSDCPECGWDFGISWEGSGHGHTITEALECVVEMLENGTRCALKPGDFNV